MLTFAFSTKSRNWYFFHTQASPVDGVAVYVPGEVGLYCVEVKHYADDHLTSKVLTDTKPQLDVWWEQTIRESHQISKKPILIFKHDRGKNFCGVDDLLIPQNTLPARYIFIGHLGIWILKLDDFIKHCKPVFIK
jgi:hypothetical protein